MRTTRERARISFPYGDLKNALKVPAAFFAQRVSQASLENLATWLDHENTNSGTFLVKVASARIFGLIHVDRTRVRLSATGSAATDPKKAKIARVTAFLSVPLYRQLFEKFKGRSLPAVAELEALMESLGVPSKQRIRARQNFIRSAVQSGLLKDRWSDFPTEVETLPEPEETEFHPLPDDAPRQTRNNGEPSPAMLALIDTLPPQGSKWPEDLRKQWFDFARRLFDRLYRS